MSLSGVILRYIFGGSTLFYTQGRISIYHNADSLTLQYVITLTQRDMKSYYYFVRNLNGFSPNDVVYKVAVGVSFKDVAKMSLVQEYSKDCGMYFEIVSPRSDAAVSQLAKSLFAGTSFPELYLRTAVVSIHELYKMIIDDSFLSFEKNLGFPRQQAQLISHLSPYFKLRNYPSPCITFCPSLRRKYLSLRKCTDFTRACIGFWLILGLFLLSAYLEGIERVTYSLW